MFGLSAPDIAGFALFLVASVAINFAWHLGGRRSFGDRADRDMQRALWVAYGALALLGIGTVCLVWGQVLANQRR